MPIYKCPKCYKQFKQKSHYDKHVYKRKTPCIHEQKRNIKRVNSKLLAGFKCPECYKLYKHKSSLSRHCRSTGHKMNAKYMLTMVEGNANVSIENFNPQPNTNIYDDSNRKQQFSIPHKPPNFGVKKRGSKLHRRCKTAIFSAPSVQSVSISAPPVQNTSISNPTIQTKYSRKQLHTQYHTPKKGYMCKYCGIFFTRKSSLNRHFKRKCFHNNLLNKKALDLLNKKIDIQNEYIESQTEQIEELVDTIEKYKEELNEIKQNIANNSLHNGANANTNTNTGIIDNSTNTINNNNNIVQNIKICAFGEENMDFINDKTCMFLLNKGYMCIPQFVK